MEKVNTLKKFIIKSSEIHNNKYDYSRSVYTKNKEPILIICPLHGEFISTPHRHLAKHGCYKCGREITGLKNYLTTERFIEKAKKVHRDTYIYTEVNYVNTKQHVKIICKTHGEFLQKPLRHLQGRNCHECSLIKKALFTISKGERYIKDFLITNEIVFEHQKQFKDCIYKKVLSFDFYLPEFNLLVEYDGTQHTNTNSKFHNGHDSLTAYKARDEVKNNYALTNNIDLLRIPYKGYKEKEYVEGILKKRLKLVHG